MQYVLTEEESKLSSGQRELLTVLRALQQEKEFLDKLGGTTLLWLTDFTNLESFLTKGSMKIEIQEQILQVFELTARYNLRISPVHVKQSDFRIQWADEGSLFFDPDDWSVDRKTFEEVRGTWHLTIDLFAHSSNTKYRRFLPYGDAPGTTGVDTFAHSWDQEIAWVCPPVHLVVDSIKKIEESVMMAILIVPVWPTANFWTMLFPDGRHAVQSCIRIKRINPHIIRGKYCQNRLMQGRTAFPFVAMYLKAAGNLGAAAYQLGNTSSCTITEVKQR